MVRIHVETEELRALSRHFEHQAHLLIEEGYRLTRDISQLEMAWQGGNSDKFIQELRGARMILNERARELYIFALRMLREADRWDESDQTWVAKFRELFRWKPKVGG